MTPRIGLPTETALVSVIMPTYNYAPFIAHALESLRAQTYPHWECLVVDDGSTDATPEIVARYAERDARIRYTRQENSRQAAARNAGLRACAGEYVQFLDADDLIEAEKFERQVGYLEEHPEVDIVYGGVEFFRTAGPEGRPEAGGEDGEWWAGVSGEGVLAALVRRNIIVINSPLVRRSVVEEAGYFDEGLPPVEDWDYWLRCAALGKRFDYRPFAGTLALVRRHPSSSSRDRRRAYRAVLLTREKIKSLTGDPSLLALNEEERIKDQERLAYEEIDCGGLGVCFTQMVRAGLANRKAKHRAKWIACACLAPFLPRVRLKALVSSPVTGFLPGG
jgi:glycosyltransferase involved in cell wall biosynthesis